MAPVTTDHQQLNEKIKDVIQDIYQVMAQTSSYDCAGHQTRDVLTNQLVALQSSLQQAHRSAVTLSHVPGIPEPLLHYVENGRNPDIYTREFVEIVRRLNQVMRGKMHAFRSFRDVLAHEMDAALPEVRDDVRRVVECTGGPGPTPQALVAGMAGLGMGSNAQAPAAGQAQQGGGGGGGGGGQGVNGNVSR